MWADKKNLVKHDNKFPYENGGLLSNLRAPVNEMQKLRSRLVK